MIINSEFAECYSEEYCYFYDGTKTIINANGSYGKNLKFDKISFVFAFLGSAIGINTKTRVKYNSFGLTLGIILIYNMFQLITDILVVSENISLAWVWLPNIVGTGIAGYLLNKKNSLLI